MVYITGVQHGCTTRVYITGVHHGCTSRVYISVANRNYFVMLWFYAYVFHFTSSAIPSNTKHGCHIPTKGPHTGTVKCLRSLLDTEKNRILQVWRRCHNAGYTGWHIHIISDHSWRPLPVLDTIGAPCIWIVLVNPDLYLFTSCVWHVLLDIVISNINL
eukprot:10821877-Ditylum_brightwellii.AAC.1